MFNIGLDTHPNSLSETEFRKEVRALGPAARRAGRRAANRTATSTRTHLSKLVREDKALKASTVKDAVSVKRAKKGVRENARVVVEPVPISLKDYGARNTRKGVTVKVKKSEGRKTLKHGFIVPAYGDHVYQREPLDVARFPIKRQYGPSVRYEVEQHREEIQDFIDETFEKRLREQFNWEIQKAWGIA